MKDLISYCPDIEALRTELTDRGYVEEETKEPVFPLGNVTPTQKSNNPVTIKLVRCVTDEDVELLNSFDSLEILGTYDEVFSDDEKYAKYSSAYPHDEYTTTYQDTGEEITVTPPKKFGVFS